MKEKLAFGFTGKILLAAIVTVDCSSYEAIRLSLLAT